MRQVKDGLVQSQHYMTPGCDLSVRKEEDVMSGSAEQFVNGRKVECTI